MSSGVVRCRAGVVAMVAGGMLVSTAHAGSPSGGAEVPERPEIEELRCAPATAVCRRGEVLSVIGPGMQGADAVVFLGGRGSRDDRRARPREKGVDRLSVKVPDGARSGRIAVVARGVGTARSDTALKVRARVQPAKTLTAAATAAAPASGVFPIAGAYDFGRTETNSFGGGRGHQGHDVFADCGTPLVAAEAGKVTNVAFQANAGNYVVIKAGDGRSHAYMHLEAASAVKVGDAVETGQPIGAVGATGRASGCHLHFELWTSPGWYSGGAAIDPLPQLKAWAAAG